MNRSKKFTIEHANELLDSLHKHQERFFFTLKEIPVFTQETIRPFLHTICKDIVQLMNCDRVEVWLFDEQQTTLSLSAHYNQGQQGNCLKPMLRKEDVPNYFEAISNQRTLIVHDLSNSPIMNGFENSYTGKDGSFETMIDASIVLSWGVGGVLCCLSREKLEWTPVHKHVVASISDMLAFVFDRVHRGEVEERVKELAYTDILTGLHNEVAFLEKVEKKLEDAEDSYFMYLIIDQYTDIQSVLGFDRADQLLVEFSKRLKSVIPNEAVVSRIGFDHFVIYSDFNYGEEEPEQYRRRFMETLKRPIDIDGQEVNITYSYGIAFYPQQVGCPKEGVQKAQIALRNGLLQSSRKVGAVYSPEMQRKLKNNLFSEMNLRNGLDLQLFMLYYQPQVHPLTGEILGFEALLRLNHPEKGVIFPKDFIELAESTGLIIPIGEWVIGEAFRQLKKWHMQGYHELTMSINISPQHFLNSKLVETIAYYMDVTRIKPEYITIEITENIALENQQLVLERIFALRNLGFKISIDDFGTGYSAYIYLQKYPIQEIKLDREFIKKIHLDAKSYQIVQSIIDLGHSLGLKTVAEGVETVEELRCLQRLKCDKIQGFYFSKPLATSEIEAALLKEPEKVYIPIEKIQ